MRRAVSIGLMAAAALACGGARRPATTTPAGWLGLPLQCRIGTDCFVQTYVDDDPGAAPRDHLCGPRTNPGHNGTDFRVKSLAEMRAGVAVLATAPGRVLRVRNDQTDMLVQKRAGGRDAVKGIECGNGLVMAHRGGWESQYCHLAQGSIRVKPGQRVRAGEALGRIGLSGDTEFPHVHYTLRHAGQVVDPFAYGAAPGSCGGGASLWKTRVPYQAGEVLEAGFATRAPTLDQALEVGEHPAPQPSRTGPALVAFVEAIGLERGDVQKIRLLGPGAQLIAEGADAPLPHDRAVSLWAVGRRTPAGGWPAGIYQADYSVRRGGVDKIVRTFRFTM